MDFFSALQRASLIVRACQRMAAPCERGATSASGSAVSNYMRRSS